VRLFTTAALRLTLTVVCVCLVVSSWGVAHAGDWKWELSPYIWATDVTLNVSVNDMEVASVEVGFKDLIDKADFGALRHFEGQRGGVGLKLGKDRDDTLWFGYRHLEFDDDDEDAGITDTEVVFSGPIFGYTFSF
jgi:hypothetical protein